MKMVCIVCPVSCSMEVKKENNEIIVKGNACPRGKDYAVSELTEPKRVLTTSLIFKDFICSVKTDKPLKKELMFEALKLIKNSPEKDYKTGEIVIKNILNTDVNVVVTGKISN